MALQPGTRLGAYEVVAPLGAGGMGEVYRARDTRLGRDVAIKVLPGAFTADPERLARFEREARVLASLSHPHIGAIYGVEEAGGVRALVLELIAGETLADRLARGPLSVRETLTIGAAIADALDAAHERGIVHRDLKPSNVMTAAGGTVKVVDFGLARPADEPGAAAAHASVATDLLTQDGSVVGTTAYMSPEQMRGQLLDRRTDIWAFGCLLYECLTGRAAFAGATRSDTIARVLEREPDWSLLPPSIPDRLCELIARCLSKDLRQRARDIGDVRMDLVASAEPRADGGRAIGTRRRMREYIAWSIAAIAVIAAAAAIALWSRAGTASPAVPVVRTTIDLPGDQKLALSQRAYPFAVSPDGSRIAYAGEADGRAQLFVRELSDLEPRRIAGTDGARQPFFSPDGHWVAYFAGPALYKVAISGGAPLRICEVPTISVGGSWGPDGTIVFVAVGAGLSKVNSAGGTPASIPGGSLAAWPQILPDGRTILFIPVPAQAIAALPIDGGTRRIVARTTESEGDGPAILGVGELHPVRVLPSGYLVYGQDPGIVRVARFDLGSLSMQGSPVSVVDGLERGAGGGAVFFATSDTGVLVYATAGVRHQLVWVDRSGAETAITADRDAFREPALSPDGSRLAVSINDETRRSDIWVYDVARGVRHRLTTAGHNLSPVWRPDGGAVTFSGGNGVGQEEVVEINPDGSGRQMLIGPSGRSMYPTSWSPDGRTLLLNSEAPAGPFVGLATRGASHVRPLIDQPFRARYARFSPDGRWVAYVSNESGRDEIYVARYPGLDRKALVSSEGGDIPRWSRDGRELFYRQGDALMAVAVENAGADLRFGTPQRLFRGPYRGASQDAQFDVSADGKRFVLVKSDEAGTLGRLTVVQNWVEDLRRRATLP